MRRYGLIGYPLSHSFSPNYFKNKFEIEGIKDTEYLSYEIESCVDFLKLFDEGVLGLNVTIPYKEQVIPFMDELDDSALSVMAVNTIKKIGDKLVGYNTDTYGFETSIPKFWWDKPQKKALVLGSGGASKAIQFVLKSQGIEPVVVSRSGNGLVYSDLNEDLFNQCALVINTTPVGMMPNTNKSPNIPYDYLSDQHLVYDLIYNPEKTLFLTLAEAQQANIQNGLLMLKQQAEKSWEIWNE